MCEECNDGFYQQGYEAGLEEARKRLLTRDEKAVISSAGTLWGDICRIIPSGPTRDADLKELIIHIHAIQRAVMSNAAGRAYPSEFRALGDVIQKEI